MNPREFLQLLIERAGLNPTSLAARLNNKPPQPQIHRFLRGESHEPRRSTLEPVARFFGVSIDAFYDPAVADKEWRRITEKSPLRVEEQQRDYLSNISPARDAHGPYPLISDVQAGMWTEIVDNFQPGDAEEWRMSAKNLGPHGYLLRVDGESMHAPGEKYNFPPGMILHVRPEQDPIPGQFVIVRRESQHAATFKRYMIIDGKPFLVAINPDWPKELKYLPLQPGDVWCGVVVDASVGSLP